LHDTEHEMVAKCCSNIGAVLQAQGKLDEAMAHFEMALPIEKNAMS